MRQLTKIDHETIQPLTSNGRITIPKNIRQLHHLQDGDSIKVILVGYYKKQEHEP